MQLNSIWLDSFHLNSFETKSFVSENFVMTLCFLNSKQKTTTTSITSHRVCTCSQSLSLSLCLFFFHVTNRPIINITAIANSYCKMLQIYCISMYIRPIIIIIIAYQAIMLSLPLHSVQILLRALMCLYPCLCVCVCVSCCWMLKIVAIIKWIWYLYLYIAASLPLFNIQFSSQTF